MDHDPLTYETEDSTASPKYINQILDDVSQQQREQQTLTKVVLVQQAVLAPLQSCVGYQL